MPSVVREWPELRVIRVDLGALSGLDDTSVASIRYAIRTTASAGMVLCFDGCDGPTAALLLSGGIGPEHLGTPRDATAKSAETLH
jgi:hypothetical protein